MAIQGELIWPTAEDAPQTIRLRGSKLPPFEPSMVHPRTWNIILRTVAEDFSHEDSEKAALCFVEVPYQMKCLDVLDEWAKLPIDADKLTTIFRDFVEVLMTRTRNSYAEDATTKLMGMYIEQEI